nr:porin family protein [Robertkochia sp. 3YJGBD-33]
MIYRKYLFSAFFLVAIFSTAAQEKDKDSLDFDYRDDRYFEDQFYLGLGYNLMLKLPEGSSQNNVSYSLQGGFIKDIPLNEQRNIALGLGAGVALNAYYSNFYALKDSQGNIAYQKIPDDTQYQRNNFSTFTADMPIEFRWRTSTATRYKFWRVYGGVKLSYLLQGRSKFVGLSNTESFENPDINDLLYGAYISFGYNTWNFYLYYQLNNMFEDGTTTIQGNPLDIKVLNFGLIFYIL